jgi:hypothetical protein
LAQLSAELGCEVQYFATHRVAEAHTWSRAVGGKLLRAYRYVGEAGEVELDIGEKTSAEAELGFTFFDGSSPEAQSDGYWERDDLRLPTEEDVMNLAGRWSVNPSILESVPDGLIGALTVPAPPAPAAPDREKPWWKVW